MDSEIQPSKLRRRDMWLSNSVYIKVFGLLVDRKHNTNQHWCGCQKKRFQFAVVFINGSLASKMKAWICLLDSVFFRAHLESYVSFWVIILGEGYRQTGTHAEKREERTIKEIEATPVKETGIFSLVKRWLMVGLKERSQKLPANSWRAMILKWN